MATPIEQLEKRLVLLESELQSYSESLMKATESVHRYTEQCHKSGLEIKEQREAITQLKGIDSVDMDIPALVARDILSHGIIYTACRQALRVN